MDIKTIAYNAIGYMLCEAGMTVREICEYIGCTEEDLRNKGLIDIEE
jgi:predicted transcriptional regulator